MLICKYDNNLLTAYISKVSPWREKKYYGRQDVEGKKIGRELLKGIEFTGVRVAILVSLFKKQTVINNIVYTNSSHD